MGIVNRTKTSLISNIKKGVHSFLDKTLEISTTVNLLRLRSANDEFRNAHNSNSCVMLYYFEKCDIIYVEL